MPLKASVRISSPSREFPFLSLGWAALKYSPTAPHTAGCQAWGKVFSQNYMSRSVKPTADWAAVIMASFQRAAYRLGWAIMPGSHFESLEFETGYDAVLALRSAVRVTPFATFFILAFLSAS